MVMIMMLLITNVLKGGRRLPFLLPTHYLGFIHIPYPNPKQSKKSLPATALLLAVYHSLSTLILINIILTILSISILLILCINIDLIILVIMKSAVRKGFPADVCVMCDATCRCVWCI